LTSQFVRFNRGANSIRYYAAQPRRIKAASRLVARDDLAVFLDEGLRWVVQQFEHRFRGPAQFCAPIGHDNRPVDQDRVRQHEIQQLIVAPFRIGKPKLRVRRALFAQQPANRKPHRLDQPDQPLAARRVLQIFDDFGFGAGLPDHGERIARRPAGRVVVDGDAHTSAFFPASAVGY
jgi:hypothetical protein